MSIDAPDRLSDAQVNHVKFFIVLFLAYFLAENITLILNSVVPSIFTPLIVIFDTLTLPIFIILLMLIIARVLLSAFPEFAISNQIPIYVAILPPLILSHPLLIASSGSSITFAWLVLDIFAENDILRWILEILLFAFSGYALLQIQVRVKPRKSRMSQIVRYLGKEILLSIFFVISSVYLVRSFVRESFESITFTIPFKLLLIFLFYLATLPIEEQSMLQEEVSKS